MDTASELEPGFADDDGVRLATPTADQGHTWAEARLDDPLVPGPFGRSQTL